MNDPLQFPFFCNEKDYPKFRALFPDKLPPTYREFISSVDKSIRERMEQETINQKSVNYDEFVSFCNLRGGTPSYNDLVECAMQIWGRKW